MAITKIHAIKATVDKAVKYICNPAKTDESILISSFGCSPETAAFDFKFALSKTSQADTNKAFHLIQSFMPGDVSYKEAHQIGTELADKLLEGKFSYVVSTHIDEAIQTVDTYEDFLALIRAKGYEIKGETFVREYSSRKLIDTSGEKFEQSPGLKHGADIQNLKIAASSYSEAGSIAELEKQLAAKSALAKTARSSLVETEHQLKDLGQILKYAEQYKDNHIYQIRYLKSKDQDAYLRRHETELLLHDGAENMLKRFGIDLKTLDVDKLRIQYNALYSKKETLQNTYKSAEKEIQSLDRKLDNLNQYLDQTETHKTAPDRKTEKKHTSL